MTNYKQERKVALWLSSLLVLAGGITMGILSQTGPQLLIILVFGYTGFQVIQVVSALCLTTGVRDNIQISCEIEAATRINFDRHVYHYVPQFKSRFRVIVSILFAVYPIFRHNNKHPVLLHSMDKVNSKGVLFVRSKWGNDPKEFEKLTYPFQLSSKLQYGKRPLFEEDEGTERYLTAKVAIEEANQ